MGSACTKPKLSKNVKEEIITILQSNSDVKNGASSFKIAHTDLIRKRTNMVIDDYKIKSTPLGKGLVKGTSFFI